MAGVTAQPEGDVPDSTYDLYKTSFWVVYGWVWIQERTQKDMCWKEIELHAQNLYTRFC